MVTELMFGDTDSTPSTGHVVSLTRSSGVAARMASAWRDHSVQVQVIEETKPREKVSTS